MRDSVPPNPRRYRILFLLMTLVAAVIAIRFAALMLFTRDQETRPTPISIERGPILDRNGRILAIQTKLNSVAAWTLNIEEPRDTAQLLAPILEQETRSILERLVSTEGFVILKRTIAPSKSDQIEQLQQAGELTGIILQPDAGRSYPERRLASPIIGYVGVDEVGLAGIEYTFDAHLAPDDAPRDSEIALGNQVFLTIDINLQYMADRLAQRTLQEHAADSVMIMVADSHDGELLASALAPGFDANNFERYDDEQRRNRAISSIYEPGSVFKIFSVAAFLDLGGITLDDYFQTSPGYVNRAGDFEILDLGDYGLLNAEGIIKYSSNVGAAMASERVTRVGFYETIRRLGFGEKTGITLNGEERALLQEPEDWSLRTLPTIAIGQEIGVTAIQMVAAATALANAGVLLKPQIVSRIASPSGEILQRYGRTPVHQALAPETAATMLRLMNATTKGNGTARRIAIEGLEISAKTGTAEVFDPQLGSYSDNHFVASCLAIVPTEEPRIIVYVVIDNPRGENFYGGRIAAPVAREIIEMLIPYLGLPRSGESIVAHSGNITVSQPSLPAFDGVIPDLRGLPKRSLLPLLNQQAIRVVIEGSGWVVRQQPAPGTTISRGMTLELQLE